MNPQEVTLVENEVIVNNSEIERRVAINKPIKVSRVYSRNHVKRLVDEGKLVRLYKIPEQNLWVYGFFHPNPEKPSTLTTTQDTNQKQEISYNNEDKSPPYIPPKPPPEAPKNIAWWLPISFFNCRVACEVTFNILFQNIFLK